MTGEVFELEPGNYYGGLGIMRTEDGRCWWSVENYDGRRWRQIPEALYLELERRYAAEAWRCPRDDDSWRGMEQVEVSLPFLDEALVSLSPQGGFVLDHPRRGRLELTMLDVPSWRPPTGAKMETE